MNLAALKVSHSAVLKVELMVDTKVGYWAERSVVARAENSALNWAV